MRLVYKMIMLDDNDFREMMILMLNMYKKGNYDIKFHPFYDGAKVMVDLECLSSCFVAPRPSSAIFLDESQADLLHPLSEFCEAVFMPRHHRTGILNLVTVG